MSEWVDCPVCGSNHENLTRCPEPLIGMSNEEKTMKRKIYLASSWRNEHQPELVVTLRNAGHDVYDFRNPKHGDCGFSWSEIDPNWRQWSTEEFRKALGHEFSARGFQLDYDGMRWADTFVLLLPSGRSAHIEAGWALGQNKAVYILMPEGEEPELMYRMVNGIASSDSELIDML